MGRRMLQGGGVTSHRLAILNRGALLSGALRVLQNATRAVHLSARPRPPIAHPQRSSAAHSSAFSDAAASHTSASRAGREHVHRAVRQTTHASTSSPSSPGFVSSSPHSPLAHTDAARSTAPAAMETSATVFYAYLRSLSDPYTGPRIAPTTSVAASNQSSETAAAPTPQVTLRSFTSPLAQEWPVRPGRGESTSSAADEPDPSTRRHAHSTYGANDTKDTSRRRPSLSSSSSARVAASTLSPERSIAECDARRVRALREGQQATLRDREAAKLVQELRQALDVLRDAERALFRFTTTPVAMPYARADHAHASNDKKQSGSGQPDSHGDDQGERASSPPTEAPETEDVGGEDTRRYRVDAFVYERVGQLQRTLRGLHTRHFEAAMMVEGTSTKKKGGTHVPASSSSSHACGSRLLVHVLDTLLRTLTHLSHLSQHATAMVTAVPPSGLSASTSRERTPHDTCGRRRPSGTHGRGGIPARHVYLPGLLPPHYAESYIRQSGCLFALREVSRVLVCLDNQTWSACASHVLRHGVQSSSASAEAPVPAPWLQLRARDVLTMLDAALTLPSDDALYVQALVPTAHSVASSGDATSTSVSLWQPVEVALEEWCVHRWLFCQKMALHVLSESTSSSSSSTAGHGTTNPVATATDEAVRRRLPAWLRPQVLSTRQWIAVIRTAMSAVKEPSNLMIRATSTSVLSGTRRGPHGGGAPRPDRRALRIPYGVGKELTILLLQYLKARAALIGPSPDTSASATDEADVTDVASALCLEDLHVRDVATLCSAVLFFDVLTTDALCVLIQAAPRCVAEVHALRGWEVGDMLLAYASLKFHGRIPDRSSPSAEPTNFYIALGTRAGELGDTLAVEDTTSVLRALEMVGIEHETLRRSFESSLRMRSVTRRQHLV